MMNHLGVGSILYQTEIGVIRTSTGSGGVVVPRSWCEAVKCWTADGLVGQAGSVYLAKRVARAPYLRDELALHGGSTKTEMNFIETPEVRQQNNISNYFLPGDYCSGRSISLILI